MVQILDSMKEHKPHDFNEWNPSYQQDYRDAFTERDVLKMNIALRLARLELKMTPEIAEQMERSQQEYAKHIKSYWETVGGYLGQAMGVKKVKGKWV